MTSQQLIDMFGVSSIIGNTWAKPLTDAMSQFGIETKVQQAQFLAQCCHESQHFKRVTENLNYSAEGLMRTWPSRFPNKAIADKYAYSPILIGNKVYASRMGNGAEDTGDGYRYRGRGIIMVTGKDNYLQCGLALKIDLIRNPDLLATTTYAALSGAWFWSKNNLNTLADNTEAVTRKINGGVIGLAERKALFEKALAVLS